MTQIVRYVPLLAFVVAAYNLIAVISATALDATLLSFGLLSGAAFIFQVKDVLELAGLILLYVELNELLRPWRVGGAGFVSLLDWHSLSPELLTGDDLDAWGQAGGGYGGYLAK